MRFLSKPLMRAPKIPRPMKSRPHVIDAKLRAACYERDHYRCQWCRRTGGRLDLHHRLARSQGGKDDLDTLVSVDRLCHAYIHNHPAEAKQRGFIVGPAA